MKICSILQTFLIFSFGEPFGKGAEKFLSNFLILLFSNFTLSFLMLFSMKKKTTTKNGKDKVIKMR